MTRDDWPPPVGSKLRLFLGEGNPNNALFHVRAIVDDRLVLREWIGGWAYRIQTRSWWEIYRQFIRVEKGRPAPR